MMDFTAYVYYKQNKYRTQIFIAKPTPWILTTQVPILEEIRN